MKLALFSKRKPPVSWEATSFIRPQLYRSPPGFPWGMLVLSENAPAILPLTPSCDAEEPILCWQLCFSTCTGHIINSMDYFKALRRLTPFVVDKRLDAILLRGLSKREWTDQVWGFRWWAEYAALDLCGGELTPIAEDDEDMLEIRYPDGGMIDVGLLSASNMYCITAVDSDDETGWAHPLFSVEAERREQLPAALQAAIYRFRK